MCLFYNYIQVAYLLSKPRKRIHLNTTTQINLIQLENQRAIMMKILFTVVLLVGLTHLIDCQSDTFEQNINFVFYNER